MADTTVYKIPDMMTGNQVDPNLLLTMMNNGNGMCGNGGWMWIIFLFFLYGWNRNGNPFGNDNNGTGYLASQAERDMLMLAINGNGSAILSLASLLNCDINHVQNAINLVQSSILQVGNQVGLSGQQVINSILQGNMSLALQFALCCCDNKLLVTLMGYDGLLRDMANTLLLASLINTINTGIERGFSSVAFETSLQTCAIQNSMKDLTQVIIDKLSSMEANALQDKINSLTALLTAANSRAERQAELAPIKDVINLIRNTLPNTVSIPYPQGTFIPNCGCQYGTYNLGFWY